MEGGEVDEEELRVGSNLNEVSLGWNGCALSCFFAGACSGSSATKGRIRIEERSKGCAGDLRCLEEDGV